MGAFGFRDSRCLINSLTVNVVCLHKSIAALGAMIKIFHFRKLLFKTALSKVAVVVRARSNALIHHHLMVVLAHVLFLLREDLFFCVLLGLLTALLFVMASAAASAALFGSFFFELESTS